MTKRFGFTLAEVLITLGIIGVVAAMTIPTLIANTNSAKFRSQFKKTLSTMNQAALMGQAQYDMNYADATKACGEAATGVTAGNEDADSHPTICAILNGTLSGKEYVDSVGTLTTSKGGTYKASATLRQKVKVAVANSDPVQYQDADIDLDNFIGYKLADGSLFAFDKNAANCTKTNKCVGIIDVNGSTLPNKEVTCDNDTSNSIAASGSGETATAAKPCVVPNDAAHMTDIYPVVFYDSTVEPATDAARYVLTTSK